MTETTTRTKPDDAADAASGGDIPITAMDVVLTLLIHVLTPMFLCSSAGNVRFARMAAAETVNAYRARNAMDLFSVAQIVAFGLGALGSLSLSMTDGLSLSMTLRLRGSCCALNRAAEQQRRALEKRQRADAMPAAAPPIAAADEAFEAEVLESMHRAEIKLAEARARLAEQVAQPAVANAVPACAPATDAVPANAVFTDGVPAEAVFTDAVPPDAALPEAVPADAMLWAAATAADAEPMHPAPNAAAADPAQAAVSTPSRPVAAAPPAAAQTDPTAAAADQRYRMMFASAMNEVAGEYTADVASLPPAQRREASIRAQALSSTAHSLLGGTLAPPFRFRLGDAAAAKPGGNPAAAGNAGQTSPTPPSNGS